MARGDPLVSPWFWQAGDYLNRAITISVGFDAARALTGATVHRDTGCLWHTIVIDVPSSVNAKTLAAPADGQPDATYTPQQLKRQGLNTIDDILALQITAE